MQTWHVILTGGSLLQGNCVSSQVLNLKIAVTSDCESPRPLYAWSCIDGHCFSIKLQIKEHMTYREGIINTLDHINNKACV